MFGAQFYPKGGPVRPEFITWTNGKTIKEIWLEADDNNLSKEDREILTDYKMYSLLAPAWSLGEYTREDVIKADYSKLSDIALDMGIEIF